VLRQKLDKKYRLYVADMNFGHFTVFRTRRHCVASRWKWITWCKWLSGQLISSEPEVLITVSWQSSQW